MKQPSIFPKVAIDMFVVQAIWTAGFLGIMLLINVVKTIMAGFRGNEVEGFFNSVFVAGNIYMLVIGILAIYFLPHFVGNGVTRKDYFFGTVLSSIGLAITIPIITGLISILEKIVLNLINIPLKVQTLNEVDISGNIIGDIVQSIIISPHVDFQSNWGLAMAVLALNIFISYLLGWLISASFYRYGTVIGLASILTAIVFKMLKDTFLRMSLDLSAVGWFSSLEDLPIGIALLGIVVIILLSIWFIRMLTKRVAIKM